MRSYLARAAGARVEKTYYIYYSIVYKEKIIYGIVYSGYNDIYPDNVVYRK